LCSKERKGEKEGVGRERKGVLSPFLSLSLSLSSLSLIENYLKCTVELLCDNPYFSLSLSLYVVSELRRIFWRAHSHVPAPSPFFPPSISAQPGVGIKSPAVLQAEAAYLTIEQTTQSRKVRRHLRCTSSLLLLFSVAHPPPRLLPATRSPSCPTRARILQL
jgi:hypothetical protein